VSSHSPCAHRHGTGTSEASCLPVRVAREPGRASAACTSNDCWTRPATWGSGNLGDDPHTPGRLPVGTQARRPVLSVHVRRYRKDQNDRRRAGLRRTSSEATGTPLPKPCAATRKSRATGGRGGPFRSTCRPFSSLTGGDQRTAPGCPPSAAKPPDRRARRGSPPRAKFPLAPNTSRAAPRNAAGRRPSGTVRPGGVCGGVGPRGDLRPADVSPRGHAGRLLSALRRGCCGRASGCDAPSRNTPFFGKTLPNPRATFRFGAPASGASQPG
jgi:hypothetical protein